MKSTLRVMAELLESLQVTAAMGLLRGPAMDSFREIRSREHLALFGYPEVDEIMAALGRRLSEREPEELPKAS